MEENTEKIQTKQTTENTQNREKKDYRNLILLLAICFSFNLFIFAPFESYIANAGKFWFGPVIFVPAFILMFLISTAICFAICRFLPKKVKWISVALIFAMTLGFYIQGNFLASGYPLLDGEEIPWHKLTSKGIVSIIVWVIIMAICFVLMFLKKNIFKNVVKVLSALILTIQIITLTFLCFTTEMPFGEKTYLSIVEEFNLSSEENIIVFVADTFEAGHMERAINEFPELKEQLKDFTFFKNTTGVGPFTYLSMVTFLSNEIFPVGKGYYAGLRESIDKSTFYEEMHEVGYDVNYYTESGFIHGKCKDKVDNLEIAESSFNIKA